MQAVTSTSMPFTRSLEDYRADQLLSIEEFAERLGLTPQTYRRLLTEPDAVRAKTKRQVRDALNVSPYLVLELRPKPSAALVAQLEAEVAYNDVHGWAEYDPESGVTTGVVRDGMGNLLDSAAGA